MAQLIALNYSPWSERAKWALDHHQIVYEYTEYVPMLGELWLRLKVSNFASQVSVPALILEEQTLNDSWQIALYAEEQGKAESLFQQKEAVKEWVDILEPALAAGRIRTTTRIRDNPIALEENLPEFIPGLLQSVSIPIAWLGSAYLIYKYGSESLEDSQRLLETMRHTLEKADQALQKNGSYILNGFSFADIAVASMLQFVKPVDNRFIFLGEQTTICWTELELIDDFAALLHWRDQLYQNHRSV